MMNNMFSMFDPSTSTFSSGWLMLVAPIAWMKNSLTKKLNKSWVTMVVLLSFVQKEINQLLGKNSKMTNATFLILFMGLLLLNANAIFPFNFTPTAHISISFTISTSMWLSTMMFGWWHQAKNMMVHLTPLGTPNPLMNFMVIIEIISSIIRPITLSIRLSANMVAGHLLMALLSSFSMTDTNNAILSSIPMMCLITLEMAVALVQAYVFMTLMILYQNETT